MKIRLTLGRLIIGGVLLFATANIPAQDLPSDLTPIPAAEASVSGTYWSMAHWPDYPPCPMNCWGVGSDLYYSPTIGTNVIWVDDRAMTSARMEAESFDYPPEPPGGSGGGTNAPDPWLPDSTRNYVRFAPLVFSVLDTNTVAANDTNLYNVIASFPPDTNTYPTLQILPYRNAVVISANHFDYSAETRDFALIVCDDVAKPIMKSIDLLGSSDAQDGWLVEGSIPPWRVTDPMFLMVTNITSVRDAFFKAIPYSGPQIDLSGASPYDTVSNTLALYAAITDLSGVSNGLFEINVDGAPARYTISTNNTINIATEYNINGFDNVNISQSSPARVYDPTNPPADAKQMFSTTASLPLDFENDTFLAFASDFCSPDVGTNYILFGIDKAQQVAATITDPATGEVLSTYSNYFPSATTVAVPWNFTHIDGSTPYTNDTYVVTFTAFDPATLTVTNTLDKSGVRTPAGCFLTYQWIDPGSPDGQYQDDQMDLHIKGNLVTLYEDLYKSLGLTQYTPDMVGTNRNHGGCYPSTSFTGNPWKDNMWNLTNHNYSDLTLGSAHGSGSRIGGPAPYGEDQDFNLGSFDPWDLRNWVSAYGTGGYGWRLRKSALWTCYSGNQTLATGGGAYNLSWPEACGIPLNVDQTKALCRKNVGIFFNGELPQRGYGGNYATTVASVAEFLDQTWICGKFQFPGGCDPTYSFEFAYQVMRNYNPEVDDAQPFWLGCPNLIYTGNYEDELMMCNWAHVKFH